VKTVTLVYAYYNNPMMLRYQLMEWARYTIPLLDRTSFIVVDDGSRVTTAIEVVADLRHEIGALDLQVYRVQVDRPWGQDAARNIGMKHCATSWALMSDIDHVLKKWEYPHFMDFVERRAAQGCYYMPDRKLGRDGTPYHPHPNSFVMHREDFWAMGGYDEDFVGWYGSDGNFRKNAKGYGGLRELPCHEFKLSLYGRDIIEDANTTSLTRKEGEYYAAKNPKLNAKRRGPPYRALDPLRAPYERVL
jgi:hypothetical protein